MICFGKEAIAHGGRAKLVRGDVFPERGCGNVSIAEHNGRLYVGYRICDYVFLGYRNRVTYPSRYMWTPSISEFDIRYGSENVMGLLDTETLDVHSQKQYLPNTEFGKNLWTGYEDVRLVSWDGGLYVSASKPYGFGDSRIPICIARIDDESYEIVGEPFYACLQQQCEKNWMPLVDIPFTYVYSTKPLQVVRMNNFGDPEKRGLECLLSKEVGNEFYKGSTQVVSYKGHYVSIVHYNDTREVCGMTEYRYLNRFAVWDENWNLVRVSEPFTFADMSVEFACGLCIHKDRVYVTFSVFDNIAFVMETPLDFFDWFTGFGSEPERRAPELSMENWFFADCDSDWAILKMADRLLADGNTKGAVTLYSDVGVKTESRLVAEYAYTKALMNIKKMALPPSDMDYTIKLIAEDRVIDQISHIV